MDVAVNDIEEWTMGQHGGITDDGNDESNEAGDINAYGDSMDRDGVGIFPEPHVGMEFESEYAAKTFYDDYARRLGFSTRINQNSRSKTDRMVTYREFLCSRGGLKRRSGDICAAMLKIESRDHDKWVVTKVVKEHSHSTVSPAAVNHLKTRRNFAAAKNSEAETHQGVDIIPSGVMYVSMDGNHVSAEISRGKNMPPSESNRIVKNTGSLCYTSGHPSRKRTLETYNVALGALREGVKKAAAVKRSVAKVAPPSSLVNGVGYDDWRTSTSAPEMTPLLWPRQDEMIRRFNLNDADVAGQPVSNMNFPHMAPVSLHQDDNHADNMVTLPCLKSMTWVMENKNAMPANRVAVINLKLQDYSRTPAGESEVKFSLSRVTLEPMLRSMAYISEQLSSPANKVAVINLKLQDTETTSGESEVKFQVSRDTLGAMLRSMAYIREQLSNAVERKQDNPVKKQRK
ncbi:unnamed protein product [Fraxinus pennsylvanica]|uniref:FAR1 domain-containing protein n=1 Tax=Fraxinus pennsylvanica TaxID=56036 RepID=A0AAD1ZGI7_9LAMI|nr:unnamed protein product [Fraxinus pennsylvanica]